MKEKIYEILKNERIKRIIDIVIGTITAYVIIYIGFKLIY